MSFFFHLISIGKNFFAFNRYLYKYSYRYLPRQKNPFVLTAIVCTLRKPHFCVSEKILKGNCLANFANEKADSFTFILRLFLSDEWKKLFSELVGLLHDWLRIMSFLTNFSILYYLPAFCKSNYRSWKRIRRKVSSNKWDVNVLISSDWKWKGSGKRNAEKEGRKKWR